MRARSLSLSLSLSLGVSLLLSPAPAPVFALSLSVKAHREAGDLLLEWGDRIEESHARFAHGARGGRRVATEDAVQAVQQRHHFKVRLCAKTNRNNY
jgi:hypothetical protein